MTPLANVAAKLRKVMPQAEVTVAEPAEPGGVGFLDVAHGGNVLAVQWQQDWHFGISSPEVHGYGEKPDETYRTADEAAARIVELLQSGGRTEPPLEVTLRKLRAELQLPQAALAALLGVSQPAVSRLERNISRMMVATLRSVVEAMGGELVLQARFPDGVVRDIVIDDSPAQPAEHDAATAAR
jgi:DNA-binding XRE family transcriptional regulator